MLNHVQGRLSGFCARVIEACWLVALVVAPLFFNVFSSRIFDPDKTAVIRTIALIIGLAWLIIWAEHRTAHGGQPDSTASPLQRTFGRLRRIPFETGLVLLLVLSLLVSLVIATLFSVAPQVSLWGSFPRLQGLYTTASYFFVFISIFALMRTRGQIDRMITTILVVSLPIALYGIIQYFGTDPLLWRGDVTERVASSLGNPLFVAAYLIMTVPITLYRLIEAGSAAVSGQKPGTMGLIVVGGAASLAFQMIAWREGPIAGTASAAIIVATWLVLGLTLGGRLPLFLRISCYTVLLSAQLMCILFSQSRGPWLGLMAGAFVFVLIWALVVRRRGLAVAVVGSGVAAVALLVALNLPRSGLGFVRDVPYVGRIGLLSNIEAGSARVRVLIWEGVEDLIAENPTRMITGYGPETLQLVYPPHYPPELGRFGPRAALPDRAHNETFDVLVSTGLPGLAIYLFLFTGLLYGGLKWIGIIRTRRQRLLFATFWFGGGGLAVALAVAIDGALRFAGFALPMGMLAGLIFYLCSYTVAHTDDRRPTEEERSLQLVAAAFLAALVAHFVEIQLGIAVTATRTYFWVYAACLLACGVARSRPALEAQSDQHRIHRRSTLASASTIVGVVLATLIYDFPVIGAGLETTFSFVWLLVFTWILAGLLLTARSSDAMPDGSEGIIKRIGLYTAFSLAPAIGFAAAYWIVVTIDIGAANIPSIYFAAVAAFVVAIAAISGRGGAYPESKGSRARGLFYAGLTIAVLFVAYRTNVIPIRADVYFKQAYQDRALARYEEAVESHRRTIELAPETDTYYVSFGKTLLQWAALSPDPSRLFEDAERLLSKARTISPRNPDHTANLADLYRAWARRTDNKRMRTTRLRRALDLSEEATRLGPYSVQIWNGLAATHVLAGDTAAALSIYDRSLALDDTYEQTYVEMGNLYFARSEWEKAAAAYQKAVDLEPGLVMPRRGLNAAEARLTGAQRP